MNGKKSQTLRRCGLLVLTMSFLALPLLTPGCGTPPERKALSAAVGTRIGVETALAIFKEQIRQGKVSPDKVSIARKALNTFKAADDAYLAALESAITTKDTKAAATAELIWKATYADLWKILVIYAPSLDPNPPSAN